MSLMLQNKFEKPLDLALKPSKIFYIYLGLIFICALLSVYIADALSLNIRLLLLVMIFFGFFLILRKNSKQCVSHLYLNNNEFQLTLNNKKYSVELFGECIVTYFIIWLNFKTTDVNEHNKKFHVLLLTDSAEKDVLRQLRARLRFMSFSDKESALSNETAKL